MSKQLQELWDKYLLIRPVPLPEYQEYLLIDNDPNWRGHNFKTTLPIRNRIFEIGRKANINKRVKPYTIRRTSITLRLDKNSKYFAGDPKLVQMMARHKKLSTTMKYDRKSDNDIRQYHMSLNDIETKKPDSLSVDKLYRLLIV
jgi:site-specific recombinase XerD